MSQACAEVEEKLMTKSVPALEELLMFYKDKEILQWCNESEF